MMRRRLGVLGSLIGLILILMLGVGLRAAGTVTSTKASYGGGLTQYTFTWTSDGSGVVSGTTVSIKAGRLVAVRFMPNGGGTQPSNLYDVTLLEGTIDLLSGQAANLSNTTGAYFSFDPPLAHDPLTPLQLSITNAGSMKGGVMTLWVAQ